MLDVESSLCKIIFRIKGQSRRSPRGQERVFGHISETNSCRESGRCQNVGEININNFCIWHFGLTYSFQDSPGSKFGPPIYMGYAKLCNPSDCSCYNSIPRIWQILLVLLNVDQSEDNRKSLWPLSSIRDFKVHVHPASGWRSSKMVPVEDLVIIDTSHTACPKRWLGGAWRVVRYKLSSNKIRVQPTVPWYSQEAELEFYISAKLF